MDNQPRMLFQLQGSELSLRVRAIEQARGLKRPTGRRSAGSLLTVLYLALATLALMAICFPPIYAFIALSVEILLATIIISLEFRLSLLPPNPKRLEDYELAQKLLQDKKTPLIEDLYTLIQESNQAAREHNRTLAMIWTFREISQPFENRLSNEVGPDMLNVCYHIQSVYCFKASINETLRHVRTTSEMRSIRNMIANDRKKIQQSRGKICEINADLMAHLNQFSQGGLSIAETQKEAGALAVTAETGHLSVIKYAKTETSER